jgi:hypothetical protein
MYFYESVTFYYTEFDAKFNELLNSRATEGWELVSAHYPQGAARVAQLIWRR